MTHPPVTDIDQILSAAADLIMHDGYNAVTFPAIAERSGAARDEVESLFDTPNDVLVSMLNREFSLMYASIVDHVDRDPRGGLLSRSLRNAARGALVLVPHLLRAARDLLQQRTKKKNERSKKKRR